MELLKRRDINISKSIIKLGKELKREFSLSTGVIEFSLIVPLEALKSVDYFTIKFNQIKGIKCFDDIKSIENDLFKLKSLEVMTVYKYGKGEDFAKLIYCGTPKECEPIRLSLNNDYCLSTSNIYISDPYSRRFDL